MTFNLREKTSAVLAAGGFGLTAFAGACGGACAATAIPLGALLASVGLGSVAILFVKFRVPLLILAVLLSISPIRAMISRKHYKAATASGVLIGFLAVFLGLQIFFPLGVFRHSRAAVAETTASAFRENFNRDAGKVRVIGLLSPGCDVCQRAHRETVTPLFERFGGEKLKGYEVWLPWVYGDSRDLAGIMAASLQDPRVEHLWDGGAELSKSFTRALNARLDVWDVYMVYAPGVKWEGQFPPRPDFFMHQLPEKYGLDPASHLDSKTFLAEVIKLL